MSTDALAARDAGPAPEPVIARDVLRRALRAAPVVVLLAAVPWGAAGAASAAFGFVVVLVNLWVAAWLLATTARVSYALMMGAALFGYVLRLALIFAAVWSVRDMAWVEELPLGLTLVGTHLGLLFWELRYVSLSLAHPALKPATFAKETSSR